MVVITITANQNPDMRDCLVFKDAETYEARSMRNEIAVRFQNLLHDDNGRSDYYDVMDTLCEWCSEKYGVSPECITPQEIEVEQ